MKLFGRNCCVRKNEIKEMFEEADSDQDKLIDFEQFIDSLKPKEEESDSDDSDDESDSSSDSSSEDETDGEV